MFTYLFTLLLPGQAAVRGMGSIHDTEAGGEEEMSGSSAGLVAVTVMGTTPSPESVVTGWHLQRLRRERLELVARVGGQGTPLSQSDKTAAKPVAVAKCRFVAW